MEYVLICFAALFASGLTLFSGFGLGTLLLPAFAIFFPVQAAVAMTAVVHLANNIFKLGIIGNKADLRAVLRFGLPALITSFAGAIMLIRLADLPPIVTYTLMDKEFSVYPVKLVIGVLMAFFAGLELMTPFKKMAFDPKFLPLGGLLSGFFGGLSGHQGAFRSAFLIKSGLGKEAFVGTGVVIAVVVDLSRITAYSGLIWSPEIRENLNLIIAASLAAFSGAIAGRMLLKKITLRSVQVLVSILLFFISAGLISGLI
ncbi:TSUP family transporter [Desulfonatronovibrio hydrogenovorans]|uniref:TSUP family transporter n=1 Tax=Desulfonatronovibrio hydrogenovorans TaxID=53245 RepID=UPI00048D3FCE|nr:TSUP family transporter [Desulfonatronovibrio hydrogenovorans]